VPVYDAFISYSHAKDKPIASALQSVIQKLGKPWYRRRGLRVFRDDTSLSATPQLWPAIEQALAQSVSSRPIRPRRGDFMPVYDAFISYSHAKDKPIAAALQAVMQRLGKPWYRRRALRVFRDDTSLSATPQLWPSIEKALGESRYLILLSSPESAASPWVGKEVEYWLKHKSIDTLFIGVTEGTLDWDNKRGDLKWSAKTPLPKALKGRFAAEPKWVDLSPYREGANPRDARFIELGADFAAAIHGMPKEDLLSQEVRQQRRALTLALSAAGLLLVLAVGAVTAGIIAKVQAERAARNFTAAKTTLDTVILDIAEGLQDVEGMRADTLRRILGRAETAMGNLAARIEDEPELRRSQGAMYGLFADTYLKLGYSRQAMAHANKAVEIFRALVAEDGRWRNNLSKSLDTVGNVRMAEGDTRRALVAYHESLDIARRLAAETSNDPRWQYAVAVSLNMIGDALKATGDFSGALAAYQENLEISRKLAEKDKDNAERQFDVAVMLDRIGDVLTAKGDLSGATAAYSELLSICRALAAKDRGNTNWQQSLAVSLEKSAAGLARQEDLQGALAAFRENLDIRRKLVAMDGENTGWQRDLSVTLNKIGDLLVAQTLGSWSKYEAWNNDKRADLTQSDLGPALATYQESLAIIRKLAAKDERNTQWELGLSINLDRIGDLLAAKGDVAGALERYRESLDIRRKLVAQENITRSGRLLSPVHLPRLAKPALTR
jgi:tetratricopeptide (TPR) repeat protein